MIYFDFHDFQVNCDDQIPAIFVLTVGLSLRYNKLIFNNIVDFRYKCFGLQDIPSILFNRRLIRKTNYNEYELKYKVKQPQSYIMNHSFLTIPYPIQKKVQYIKLLSYRAINNSNSWIPLDYIENPSKIKDNALLSVTNNKIHFKYEGTKQ